MKTHSKRALLANIFGAMGYISCLLLWGWVGMLYLPMLLENEKIEQLLLPRPSEEVVVPGPSTEVSPTALIFAVTVTVIVMIATVIVLLRAPKTIAQTGKTVTTKVADTTLPLITRGRPLTPAKKRYLTANLVKLAKLLLVLLPVAVGFLGIFLELPLPFDLTLFVTSLLALFAVLWFSLQYICARLLRVNAALLV